MADENKPLPSRIQVLRGNDFLIMYDGEIIPVAAYFRKYDNTRDIPQSPRVAVASFNARDIDDPEKLQGILNAIPGMVAPLTSLPTLDFLDLHFNEGSGHFLSELPKTANTYPGIADYVIEKAREQMAAISSIKKELPKQKEIDELQAELHHELSTPSPAVPEEFARMLDVSRSTFLIAPQDLVDKTGRAAHDFYMVPFETTRLAYNSARIDQDQQTAEIALTRMLDIFPGCFDVVGYKFFQVLEHEYSAAFNKQAEPDASQGQRNLEQYAEHMLHVHTEVQLPDAIDAADSVAKLKAAPNNLLFYLGLRATAKQELRKWEKSVLKDWSEQMPKVDGETPWPPHLLISEKHSDGQRDFFEHLNDMLDELGSDAKELDHRQAQAMSEYVSLFIHQSIGEAFNAVGFHKDTDAWKHVAIQHNLNFSPMAASGRVKLNKLSAAPGFTRSSEYHKTNKKNFEDSWAGIAGRMRMFTQGVTDALEMEMEKHRDMMIDMIRLLYTPHLGIEIESEKLAINPLYFDISPENKKWIRKIDHSALLEYAAGVRDLTDLVDIHPWYSMLTPSPLQMPSPRELFIASLEDGFRDIAKHKNLDGTQLHRLDEQIKEMKKLFAQAVIPPEVESMKASGVELGKLRAQFDSLRKPLDNAKVVEALGPVFEKYHFTKESINELLARPADVPASIAIPAFAAGLTRAYDRHCRILEDCMPILRSLREEHQHLENCDKVVAVNTRITEHAFHGLASVLVDNTHQFDDVLELKAKYFPHAHTDEAHEDPSKASTDELRNAAFNDRQFVARYLAYIIEIEKQIKLMEEQYKADTSKKKPDEKKVQNGPFTEEQKMARTLHQAVTQGSGDPMLKPVWEAQVAPLIAATASPDLSGLKNTVFGNYPMQVLDYATAASTTRFGDAQALGSRFSKTRAEQKSIRKAIGDAMELAALGDEASEAAVRALLGAPLLLASLTGERSVVDDAKRQVQEGKQPGPAFARAALQKIGVAETTIEHFLPAPKAEPKKAEIPRYVTKTGVELYTKSPRHANLVGIIDSFKADADMFMLKALDTSKNRFQCELKANDAHQYSLTLLFADREAGREQVSIPLPVNNMDDALDIKIAVQSYILNKEEIEPLRRISAGGVIGVEMNEAVPIRAGDKNARVNINGNNGLLYLSINFSGRRNEDAGRVSFPLGLADLPENAEEAEVRSKFVVDMLRESHEKRRWFYKREVFEQLRQNVTLERAKDWIDLKGNRLVMDGYEDATPLSFPAPPSKQKTFMSPASLFLQPGGNNPTYVLNFSLHVNDEEGQRGMGTYVYGPSRNLHTSDLALAESRARKVLEQVQRNFEARARKEPGMQWALVPAEQHKRIKRGTKGKFTPLVSFSDSEEPLMTRVKLKELLTDTTRYEDDVKIVETSRKTEDGKVIIRLEAQRAHRTDKLFDPKLTAETLRTSTLDDKVVPMAVTIAVPAEHAGGIRAFVDDANSKLVWGLGQHYGTVSLAAGAEERDRDIESHEYREETALRLFRSAVMESYKGLKGAEIVEPVPPPIRAKKKILSKRQGDQEAGVKQDIGNER